MGSRLLLSQQDILEYQKPPRRTRYFSIFLEIHLSHARLPSTLDRPDFLGKGSLCQFCHASVWNLLAPSQNPCGHPTLLVLTPCLIERYCPNGNVGEDIERYTAYAQSFTGWFGPQIKEKIDFSPRWLHYIDAHFWAATSIPSMLHSQYLPYVGAYLGEIIIRHLGGRWVPRENIEEAQIVVGDRVWLPFLRAKHALQSKDAALDYSLIKFYRMVERYVRGEQA